MLSFIYLIPVYVIMTYILFLSDIFLWPIDSYGVLLLTIFMSLVILVQYVGIYIGLRVRLPFGIYEGFSGRKITKYFIQICIVLICLIFLAVSMYTGGNVSDLFFLATNPRLAYERMLNFDVDKSLIFYLYKFLAVTVAPLYYSIVPLLILRWRFLSKKQVIFGFFFILTLIVFSIFRGTDREIGEIVIMIFGASIIRIAQKAYHKEISICSIMKIAISLLLVFLFFLVLFSFRKYERLSGNIEFCVYDVVCLNENSFIHSFLSDEIYFSIGMLTAYLSQGYYGLYLTMKVDSCFTFFMGHSPFLTSAFDKLFNMDIYECSLFGQLNSLGWSDSYTWSSIYPWLANDLSYYFVVPFLFFISLIFSLSWRISIQYDLFSSSMVFIFLLYGVVFSVANNQLAIAPEIYVSFITWCIFLLKDIRWKKNIAS